MMRLSPLKLALAVAALAAALDGAATARSEGAPAAPATAPIQVRLVDVAPGEAAGWAAASLASAQHATLSTRLSATVRAVAVEEGARVKQGELLIRLSDDDVRAQLSAAQTALASAAAHERRIRELAAQRAATPSELEQAEAQRAQAQAAVAGAKASLAYAELRAPFSGTVQAKRVNAGDLVGPGQPLLDVQGAGLEVQASLSEAEASGLRLGQRLRFQAGDRRGEAEITALTPGGDPLSHRRFLRGRVLGGAQGLRSGTFARLELPGAPAAPRQAWVPRSAIVERGDLTGVFVAVQGQAQLRWISLGEPAGDRFPVRAGLRPGEAVIDAPGALRDGEAVEVSRGP
ncbi:efflux RND transporter periplasmic adaptor subunit [Anaeromyxobacter diazotrophicus]|uniref:Acriflavin resistance protein n=1 Tax=Anaeromyxobacter diazotrophicus TaxID=2590199 RepID=A0A7I9VIQ9_9BACT|nr:efflux RND transporter periplasmic adaptor subunit [Anaeromyxobacter diazotrophicus]GEJ56028.1 acriflavin resistance protein [Anaeromyxobacter diazotrophicus]